MERGGNRLLDASARAGYTLTNEDFDAGTGLLKIDLTVTNFDSVPLHGPARVSLADLTSGLARRVEG